MKTVQCWIVALCLGLMGCAHKQVAGAEVASSESAATGSVQTEEVSYSSGSTPLKGFLASPGNVTSKRPGVLVVHEWWGLNDYSRARAKKLAEMGYVALAVDMFGEGKQADHPESANQMMMDLMSNQDE